MRCFAALIMIVSLAGCCPADEPISNKEIAAKNAECVALGFKRVKIIYSISRITDIQCFPGE